MKKSQSLNSRETLDLLTLYFKDLSLFEVLEPEKQKEFFIKYENGSELARDLLIHTNLKLVIPIALKYSSPNRPFSDLIQAGNIGLIRAVDKFDYKRGTQLSTYANKWIKKEIEEYLYFNERMIRLPREVYYKFNKLRKTEERITREKGQEPSVEELADKLDITFEEVQKLLNYKNGLTTFSTDVIDNVDVKTVGDNDPNIDPHQYAMDLEVFNAVNEVLNQFEPSEAIILKYRLLSDFYLVPKKTLKQLGKILGVTGESVRQKEKKLNIKCLELLIEYNEKYNSDGIKRTKKR